MVVVMVVMFFSLSVLSCLDDSSPVCLFDIDFFTMNLGNRRREKLCLLNL